MEVFKREDQITIDRWLFGYLEGQFPIALNQPDPSLGVSVKFVQMPSRPVRFMRHMGIIEPDGGTTLVMFHPDMDCLANRIGAVVHRVGRLMPQPDVVIMRQFLDFAFLFITGRIASVVPGDVLTAENFVKTGPWTGGRKLDLLRLLRVTTTVAEDRLYQKVAGSKCFIKDEGYEEPKHARAICSPSDLSKVLVGNLISAADHATFESLRAWSVKGTDPRDWPRREREMFSDGPVFCTDFSSFEAHHRGVYSHIVWIWIKHMLRGIDGISVQRRLIRALILGRNVMEFKGVTFKLDRRLMSGSCWTSSANFMLNLLSMSFLFFRAEMPMGNPHIWVQNFDRFVGLVEGDDGICRQFAVNQLDITRMGLRLEMEFHPNFSSAGFCSIYCNPVDLECVKDPRKILRSFFWLPTKYAKCAKNKVLGLIRAKALSYKYLLGNNPIVGHLCDWVLFRTRSKRAIWWEPMYLLEHIDKKLLLASWRNKSVVSDFSRQYVHHNFGISPQLQRSIESSFDWGSDVVKFDFSFLADDRVYELGRVMVSRSEKFQHPEFEPDALIQALSLGRRGIASRHAVNANFRVVNEENGL